MYLNSRKLEPAISVDFLQKGEGKIFFFWFVFFRRIQQNLTERFRIVTVCSGPAERGRTGTSFPVGVWKLFLGAVGVCGSWSHQTLFGDSGNVTLHVPAGDAASPVWGLESPAGIAVLGPSAASFSSLIKARVIE